MGLRTQLQRFLRPTTTSTGVVARTFGMQTTTPQQQLQGVTFKAVQFIGQSLSVYEPIITRKNGDAYVNHPLLTLFNQPNTIQTNASDFLMTWGMLNEIYGETFWYIVRGENTRRPKELILLNPANVQLKLDDETGEVIGYILLKSNGEQVPFDVDEIIHDKQANPFNEYRGMSILEKSATYIDTERVSADFTKNYINNAASPSGIVTLPEMGKDAFQQFVLQWREQYEGPHNAGKTGFLKGGEAKFTAVGSTLQDIDQKVTREMARDDVLMMFGIPKGLLGVSGQQGLGRNELEPLEYIYAKYKIEPLMKRLDRIYSVIGSQFTREGVVDVKHESPIPNDKEFVLKQQRAGVNVWMTVNETRALQGLEDIAEGDEIKPENRFRQPSQNADVNESVDVQVKKKITLKKEPTKAEVEKQIQDEKEKFRSKLEKIDDRYAVKLQKEIGNYVTNQEKGVIDKISASNKAFEEWLFNIKEETEALTVLLAPIIIEAMEEAGEETAHFITGELLTITPEIKHEVEAHIKEIVGVFNKGTIDALESTLAEGIGNGESLVKLKARVEQVFTDAKGYRAQRIAKTESARASNRAAQLAYKQSGYTKQEWFKNPTACEFCLAITTESSELGSRYLQIGQVLTGTEGGQMRIEYDNIDYPPLHPNCQCKLLPAS